MLRPGMRTYLIPLLAGACLVVSTFLPWVVVGDVVLRGFPDVAALWVLGLGAIAVVLATLSLITRKNSRHPLLVIGLVALGIMFLSWRVMPGAVGERVQTLSQAKAIVEGRQMGEAPAPLTGMGIYLGLVASAVIAAFGLTIVVKRAKQPYLVAAADDDV